MAREVWSRKEGLESRRRSRSTPRGEIVPEETKISNSSLLEGFKTGLMTMLENFSCSFGLLSLIELINN